MPTIYTEYMYGVTSIFGLVARQNIVYEQISESYLLMSYLSDSWVFSGPDVP